MPEQPLSEPIYYSEFRHELRSGRLRRKYLPAAQACLSCDRGLLRLAEKREGQDEACPAPSHEPSPPRLAMCRCGARGASKGRFARQGLAEISLAVRRAGTRGPQRMKLPSGRLDGRAESLPRSSVRIHSGNGSQHDAAKLGMDLSTNRKGEMYAANPAPTPSSTSRMRWLTTDSRVRRAAAAPKTSKLGRSNYVAEMAKIDRQLGINPDRMRATSATH
jgi:hypothetical protein